jgi:hypothetical protein
MRKREEKNEFELGLNFPTFHERVIDGTCVFNAVFVASRNEN